MGRLLDLRFRRGSATQWSATNPVLNLGEPGYDSDNRNVRIGDGATPWSGLSPLPNLAYTDTAVGNRMRYTGAWSSTAAYAVNDVVVNNGAAYVCIRVVPAAAATSFVTSGAFVNATGAADTLPLPASAVVGDTIVIGLNVFTGAVTRIAPFAAATLISPALNYGNNSVFGWIYSYTLTASDITAGGLALGSQSPNTGYALTYHLFRNLGTPGLNAGSNNISGGTPTLTPASYPSWIFTTAFANTLATSSVATQANQSALQSSFLSGKITAAAGYEVLAAGTSASRVYTLTNINGTGANLAVALGTTSSVNTSPDLATTSWTALSSPMTAIGKTQLAITAGTPGWRVFPSQAPLAYSRTMEGLVTLEGYLQPNTAATVAGTSYTIAQLPVGCRPLDGPGFFPSTAYPTSTTATPIPARISVDTGGLIRIFTPVIVPLSAGVTVTGSFMAQQ